MEYIQHVNVQLCLINCSSFQADDILWNVLQCYDRIFQSFNEIMIWTKQDSKNVYLGKAYHNWSLKNLSQKNKHFHSEITALWIMFTLNKS